MEAGNVRQNFLFKSRSKLTSIWAIKRSKGGREKKRNFKGVRSPYKIDDRNFRQNFRQNFS